MNDLVVLTNGTLSLTTLQSTALLCPLFRKAIELGQTSPIFIDLEDDALRAVLEVSRNGDQYAVPPDQQAGVQAAWDASIERTLELDYRRIQLIVGGTTFHASKRSLQRAPYFQAQERFDKEERPAFYDRDPLAFAHVLRYLRQPSYRVPCEFEYELAFWGIDLAKPSKVNTRELTERVKLFTEFAPMAKTLPHAYLTERPHFTWWANLTQNYVDFFMHPRVFVATGPVAAGKNINFYLDWRAGDVLHAPWLSIQIDPSVVWDPNDPRGIAQLIEGVKFAPEACRDDPLCITFDGWTILFAMERLQIPLERLFKPIGGSFVVPLPFFDHKSIQEHPLICCPASVVLRFTKAFRGDCQLLFDAVHVHDSERERFALNSQERLLHGPYESTWHCGPDIDLDWFEGPLTSAVICIEGCESDQASGELLVDGKVAATFDAVLQARSNWHCWNSERHCFFRIQFHLSEDSSQPSGALNVKKGQLSLCINGRNEGIRVWLYGYRVLQLYLTGPRDQVPEHTARLYVGHQREPMPGPPRDQLFDYGVARPAPHPNTHPVPPSQL